MGNKAVLSPATSWTGVPFTEIAALVRREVQIDPDEMYQEIGVYAHGKGIFHKEHRSGADIGDKAIYWIDPTDFIMQIVFAWEGAITPATDAEAGMVGSHRYLTFQIDPSKADRRFLYWWFRTEPALKQVLRISPGSAGRNRTLGTKRIHEIVVPLPCVEEQQGIACLATIRTAH